MVICDVSYYLRVDEWHPEGLPDFHFTDLDIFKLFVASYHGDMVTADLGIFVNNLTLKNLFRHLNDHVGTSLVYHSKCTGAFLVPVPVDNNFYFFSSFSIRHVNAPVLYGPVLYSPVLYSPVLYGPVLYGPVLYGPVLYGPVLYGPVYGPVLYGPVLYGPVLYGPVLCTNNRWIQKRKV